MGRIAYMVAAAVIVAGEVANAAIETAYADTGGSSDFGITMPLGYRDWRLISVAHEAGKLNDIRAILGNDIAVKSFRDRTRPFPDGAIIARLAWTYTSSEENNKAFGGPQSFVAGTPSNVQFMIKDSVKYASTGGWGFVQFNDGKPAQGAALRGCFTCHLPVKSRDFVFTQYSP